MAMPGFFGAWASNHDDHPNKNYELKKNTYLISRYLAQ
jgi:hypothetical protein